MQDVMISYLDSDLKAQELTDAISNRLGIHSMGTGSWTQ
jgi:hypothetical protein